MSKIEETVFGLAEPIATHHGLRIYDVEFKKEGGNNFLRIYIDKDGGVTIDDCEKVSRDIDAELDRLDPIPSAYCLEVSSPGLDRTLRKNEHFLSAIGERIDVKLFEAIDGKKLLSGTLDKVEGDIIFLTEDNTRQKHNIKKALTAVVKVRFEESEWL